VACIDIFTDARETVRSRDSRRVRSTPRSDSESCAVTTALWGRIVRDVQDLIVRTIRVSIRAHFGRPRRVPANTQCTPLAVAPDTGSMA